MIETGVMNKSVDECLIVCLTMEQLVETWGGLRRLAGDNYALVKKRFLTEQKHKFFIPILRNLL